MDAPALDPNGPALVARISVAEEKLSFEAGGVSGDCFDVEREDFSVLQRLSSMRVTAESRGLGRQRNGLVKGAGCPPKLVVCASKA